MATARQLAEVLSQHTALARAVVAAWRTKRSHHFPIRALIQYHSLSDLIAQLHQVTGEKSDPRCRFEKAQSPKQWLAGGAFDWAAVTPSEGAVSAEVLALLPLYPFTRQRYWAEGLLAESTPLSSPSVIAHPLDFSFVRTWVAETLAIASGALSDEDDLLSLGLDSLQMLDLVDECKKRHITLTLARLFEKTTLGAWEQYWDSICRSGVCGESVSAVTPLTEEQTTDEYWQGEPF
ncbi:phosphopantetheine-binding protein, partial [Yersinia pestis]